MNHEVEQGVSLKLDFDKLIQIGVSGQRVIPVVVQHALTQAVLLVAYVNEEALRYSITHKVATFWSTSRNALWIKGDTSGDRLTVDSVWVNCEQNSLLFRVIPEQEGVCHTRDEAGATRSTCFYREVLDLNTLVFSLTKA